MADGIPDVISITVFRHNMDTAIHSLEVFIEDSSKDGQIAHNEVILHQIHHIAHIRDPQRKTIKSRIITLSVLHFQITIKETIDTFTST